MAKVKSASPGSLTENIGVAPIVVAKLELSDVERHIFLAYFMESTD
jgi:hypothetical protein